MIIFRLTHLLKCLSITDPAYFAPTTTSTILTLLFLTQTSVSFIMTMSPFDNMRELKGWLIRVIRMKIRDGSLKNKIRLL